jgi:hypothetical protein
MKVRQSLKEIYTEQGSQLTSNCNRLAALMREQLTALTKCEDMKQQKISRSMTCCLHKSIAPALQCFYVDVNGGEILLTLYLRFWCQ